MVSAKNPNKAKPHSVLSDVGHTLVDTAALLGAMVTEGGLAGSAVLSAENAMEEVEEAINASRGGKGMDQNPTTPAKSGGGHK